MTSNCVQALENFGAGTAVTSPEASLSSINVSEFLNLFWQSRSQTGSQGF